MICKSCNSEIKTLTQRCMKIGFGANSNVYTLCNPIKPSIVEKHFITNKIEEEIKVIPLLNKLKNKFLVKPISTNYMDKIYYPYIEGEEFFDRIVKDNIDPKKINSIFKDISEGAYLLSKENVIHGDLKPENIIINSDNKIKIIDYGSLKMKNSDKKLFGTYSYCAPDITKIDNNNVDKIDSYSIAMILYCQIYGSNPFQENIDVGNFKINQNIYDKYFMKEIYDDINLNYHHKEILINSLQYNPDNRWDIKDLYYYFSDI